MTPRQPGSTMKPLLYALALERGWTAATLIDDSEMSESVRGGQHTFHNYSHVHYGALRLREALGNGEVSLYEMAQAYTALARQGDYLTRSPPEPAPVPGMRRVAWYVDGRQVSSTTVDSYAWPLVPGAHEVYSRIWDEPTHDAHMTDVVRFYVH
jgi:membrane carboxypeptidase/penicillin-binding protein PbpC